MQDAKDMCHKQDKQILKDSGGRGEVRATNCEKIDSMISSQVLGENQTG